MNVDTIVIGAGQAGLAMGWHLRQAGRTFAIVDAGPAIGHSWRSRWDSLTLFTPGRYDGLPGMPFPGPADRYPGKDEVADYLAAYARAFDLPVHLDTPVHRLSRGFVLHTGRGTWTSHNVVVATGPFQRPYVPAVAAGLDPSVRQVHSADYRNPDGLPAGPVVVVGAGNSGIQIARELAATRPVTVAVGAQGPRLPQRILGRDLFWWLVRLGLMSRPADSRLARRVRARGELVIGAGLRQLTGTGVDIRGRVVATRGNTVEFADGSVVAAESVVWATGFRTDDSWIDADAVPGVHFLGRHWQYTRGSSLLGFVGADAARLAAQLPDPRGAEPILGRQT